MRTAPRILETAGLLLTAALLMAFPATLSGCGDDAAAPTTTSAAGPGTTGPGGPPTLADVEGYRDWLKMNLEPVQGRTHGLTDIYVNQERDIIAPDGTLAFPFPDGTLIVKEQVEGSLIAIMRKTAGIDPEHGDWQWIEYGTDGRIVGQDAGCWSCHGDARSTDWVYTTLETP
jgi:hypothetical protein